MSNNRLEINTKAFLQELRKLPESLRGDGARVVAGAASKAAQELRRAYTEGPTGNLKAGIKVETNATKFGTGAVVKVTAKHAHLYEFGTQIRRNKAGANRGAMPPKPTAIPVFIRRRREMYEQLIDLLERQGLQVTGSAE